MPKSGKLVSIKGNTAQCIAHANEAVIPNASQFILKFIACAKIIIAISLQKFSLNQLLQLKHLYFCCYIMKKKSLYYLGFFGVLLVLFWIGLAVFTETFNQSKLQKNAYVQKFSFLKEDGSVFTNADVKEKVYVVEYFFTTCPSICPKMNNNMRTIYEAFKDEPNFMILSHTCDPKRDSVAQLKHFADSMKVDTRKWAFLTGRKDSLYNIARFSYGIDDPKNVVNNIEDDFMHSQFFALVDKNGIVRGQVYDGLKTEELEKLKKDIQDLLKEKPMGKNFTNGLFN